MGFLVHIGLEGLREALGLIENASMTSHSARMVSETMRHHLCHGGCHGLLHDLAQSQSNALREARTQLGGDLRGDRVHDLRKCRKILASAIIPDGFHQIGAESASTTWSFESSREPRAD